MPQNITDDPTTYTNPIVVPVSGEAGLAAGMKVGFQGLSNRTAFLKAALATLVASAGAASGIATLDGTGKVPLAELPLGSANGAALLDGGGRLPAATPHNGIISIQSYSQVGGALVTFGLTASFNFTAAIGDWFIALLSAEGTNGTIGILGAPFVGSGATAGIVAAGSGGSMAVGQASAAGAVTIATFEPGTGGLSTFGQLGFTVIQIRP